MALPTRLIYIDLAVALAILAGGAWVIRDPGALNGYGVAIFAIFAALCLLLVIEQPSTLPIDFALLASFAPALALKPRSALAAIIIGTLVAALLGAVGRWLRPGARRLQACGARVLVRTMGIYGAIALAATGIYRLAGGTLPISAAQVSFAWGDLLRAAGVLALALAALTGLWTALASVNVRRLLVAETSSLLLAGLTGWAYSPHTGHPGIAALTVGGVAVALGLVVAVARVQAALQQRANELAALNWVGHMVTTESAAASLFEGLYRQVAAFCDAPIFTIALYDDNQGSLSFPYGRDRGHSISWPDSPLDDSATAYVIRARRSLLLAGDTAKRASALGLSAPACACYLGVPLIAGDEVMGAIVLQHDTNPHAYGRFERELLEGIAPQAAVALRNARLFEEAQTLSAELQELVASSREFSATLDVSALAERIVRRLRSAASARAVTLLEWNPENGTFRRLAHLPTETGDLVPRLLENHHEALQNKMRGADPTTLAIDQEGTAWRASAMPLVARDRPVGLAVIWDRPGDTAPPGSSRLVEGIIHQAAVALQNAQAYSRADASLRERVIELSAIEVISRHMAATLDIETIINDVLAAAMSAIDAAQGSCGLLVDDEHFMLVAMLDQSGAQADLPALKHVSYGMARRVLRDYQPVCCGDVLDEPDYAPLLPDTRSELCVPIMREGRPTGLLSFYDPRPHAFTEAHTRFVSTLAEHASIALENARLFTDRRRQVETLVSLRRISTELLAAVQREQIADTVLDFVRDTLHTDRLALYWVDVENGAGSQRLIHARDNGAPPPDSLACEVAQSGQPYYSVDLATRPVYQMFMPLPDFQARACLPIRRGDRTLGVLDVTITDSLRYTQNEVQALEVLAGQAAVAIETLRLHDIVRAGRDQLQAVLNSTREGILLFDPKGRLLLANAAAEEMLGQPLGMIREHSYLDWLRAQRLGQLQALTGHTLASLRRYMQQVTRDPRGVMHRQFMQQRDTGSRYIDEIGSPVLDERGKTLIGWMLVWRDITEERQLDDLRQELSSMLVHDLRSPLTAIISGLTLLDDLLHEETIDRETLQEVVGIASVSSDSMLRLVESLLDIARLEQHHVALDLSVCRLRDLVDGAYAQVLSLALEAAIIIEINVSDDLPPVSIDITQIQRVLVNLLDNALRHTPYSGQVAIDAALTPEGDAVCVTVSDSGPGILPEGRAVIFEKFTQLDQAVLRGHKGSGLGLTFCKLVVEAHGGRIWVEDSALGGAAFRFTLPLADARFLGASSASLGGSTGSL